MDSPQDQDKPAEYVVLKTELLISSEPKELKYTRRTHDWFAFSQKLNKLFILTHNDILKVADFSLFRGVQMLQFENFDLSHLKAVENDRSAADLELSDQTPLRKNFFLDMKLSSCGTYLILSMKRVGFVVDLDGLLNKKQKNLHFYTFKCMESPRMFESCFKILYFEWSPKKPQFITLDNNNRLRVHSTGRKDAPIKFPHIDAHKIFKLYNFSAVTYSRCGSLIYGFASESDRFVVISSETLNVIIYKRFAFLGWEYVLKILQFFEPLPGILVVGCLRKKYYEDPTKATACLLIVKGIFTKSEVNFSFIPLEQTPLNRNTIQFYFQYSEQMQKLFVSHSLSKNLEIFHLTTTAMEKTEQVVLPYYCRSFALTFNTLPFPHEQSLKSGDPNQFKHLVAMRFFVFTEKGKLLGYELHSKLIQKQQSTFPLPFHRVVQEEDEIHANFYEGSVFPYFLRNLPQKMQELKRRELNNSQAEIFSQSNVDDELLSRLRQYSAEPLEFGLNLSSFKFPYFDGVSPMDESLSLLLKKRTGRRRLRDVNGSAESLRESSNPLPINERTKNQSVKDLFAADTPFITRSGSLPLELRFAFQNMWRWEILSVLRFPEMIITFPKTRAYQNLEKKKYYFEKRKQKAFQGKRIEQEQEQGQEFHVFKNRKSSLSPNSLDLKDAFVPRIKNNNNLDLFKSTVSLFHPISVSKSDKENKLKYSLCNKKTLSYPQIWKIKNAASANPEYKEIKIEQDGNFPYNFSFIFETLKVKLLVSQEILYKSCNFFKKFLNGKWSEIQCASIQMDRFGDPLQGWKGVLDCCVKKRINKDSSLTDTWWVADKYCINEVKSCIRDMVYSQLNPLNVEEFLRCVKKNDGDDVLKFTLFMYLLRESNTIRLHFKGVATKSLPKYLRGELSKLELFGSCKF